MDNITMDSYNHIELGYDAFEKEYYVADRLEHRWRWFKRLSEAKSFYEFLKGNKWIKNN